MRKLTRLFAVALLSGLFFVAGCSKLSMENYARLKVGMEYSEVIGILGSPDTCSDAMGVKNCVWGEEARNITVLFLADKTMAFTSTGLK